jgi:hypothetical protein
MYPTPRHPEDVDSEATNRLSVEIPLIEGLHALTGVLRQDYCTSHIPKVPTNLVAYR